MTGPAVEPTPESSSVEEIGYDADAEEVWVRFRNAGALAGLNGSSQQRVVGSAA